MSSSAFEMLMQRVQELQHLTAEELFKKLESPQPLWLPLRDPSSSTSGD